MTSLTTSGRKPQRKKQSKMSPLMALGRILVPRRLASPPIGGLLVKRNVNLAFPFHWTRMYVCVTKSAQGSRKLIFGEVVGPDCGSSKCQNGVRDLDMEIEIEVRVERS